MDTPQILTVREAAQQLRCSETMIRRLFRKGELQGFRLGSDIRIQAITIGDFIERHKNKGPEPKVVPVVNFRRRKIEPALTGLQFLTRPRQS